MLRRTVRGQYGPGTVKGAKQRWVPRRGQGASRLQHRDVRGAGAVHRQLALGRRPVLSPHGEDAAETGDGGDDPVQARAVRAVSRHAGRDARAESAGDSHPAGRRHLPQLQREDPRAAAAPRQRQHAGSTTPITSASSRTPGTSACSTMRCSGMPRSSSGPTWWKRLVRGAADSRRLEGAAAAQVPELRRRQRGARPKPRS